MYLYIGSKLLGTSLGDGFLELISKAKESKSNQQGNASTKKLLHSKENHQQNEKAACSEGENICKSYVWWETKIQNT